MKRIIAVFLLIVAAAFAVVVYDNPDALPWLRWFHQPEVVRSAEPPARTASGPVEAAPPEQQQVEQVGESADSATPLQEILPRQSEGHRQALSDTKDALRLHSSAALVLDANTRQELYAKNPDAVLPIASITKLMTAMVIAESNVPMDEVITITEDDMDKERHSRSRLRVGSVLSRSEALHLALMSSENRAAHALGRTFPGGLEKFVQAMNHKAQLLGMTHTHYVEPTGLSSDNRSTPRDLATLVMAATKYPMLRAYSTDKAHLVAFGNRKLQYKNSNALVRGDKWDIELQKTGYIVEAGHCVVMQTQLHGQELVMVLLDSDSNGRRNADAEKLRSWWNARNGYVEEHKVAAKAEPRAEKKAAAKADKKDDGKDEKKQAKKDDRKKPKAEHKVADEAKGKRVHAQFAAK